MERDSFIETVKTVYEFEHRIIVHHSSNLEKRRIMSFMERFRTVYRKVRSIMESGDSDAIAKTKHYLESMHLHETIHFPDLKIDRERVQSRFGMLGKTALFINISDLEAKDLIGLYIKWNRVEHCFRTISMHDLMAPEYHWTPQEIRVHMLFSHIAYLFLALIYNRISEIGSLASTTDILNTIRITVLARGKVVREVVTSQDERGKKTIEIVGIGKIS